MSYSNFMMQQEDENREDLDRAAAFGNACRECLSVMHDTADHAEHRPEPLKQYEVRLELTGLFSNQFGNSWTGYAKSDGWQSTTNSEEQFIVHNPDGAQMGRFDYRDLVPYLVQPEPEQAPEPVDAQGDTAEGRLNDELNDAAAKAWDALSRYKFQMFGYWAGIWVHLNKIEGKKRPNPFRSAVLVAKRHERGES